jgi:15-cis-phytoene synthase
MNPAVSQATVASAPEAAAAYAVCRRITRHAARNFYYAFLVLPRPKRDALSAVYAFMRQCDDISDEPGLAPGEKRERLASWLESLHRAIDGLHSDDPVLLALSDAVRRFDIPVRLLDQLAHGTAMDLDEDGRPIRYASFDDLYSYCYYVASVVGLVTIRIFGYRDAQAEPLAEQCGVAFQLTNIIRDVKEDARMGRVYLPEADLAAFGCSAADLDNGYNLVKLRPVLEREAERARQFYRAADQLLPLIEEDSQPALWVLVTIYRRLLEKIASRGYDVRTKVQLSTTEKLRVLSQGWWRRLAA